MTYRRWYDADPRVSAVVHAMEDLNRDSQLYLAQKMLELSETFLVDLGGDTYLAALDPKKQEGLNKADSKNRWYDRDDRLHKAFKNLYALPNSERRDIAMRLATPIQIVEGYERHCMRQGTKPEMRIVEEILRSSFVEGQERARKLYSVYLYDFVVAAASTPNARSDESVEEEPKGGLWSHLLRSLQEAMA
jgi:phage-related protein